MLENRAGGGTPSLPVDRDRTAIAFTVSGWPTAESPAMIGVGFPQPVRKTRADHERRRQAGCQRKRQAVNAAAATAQASSVTRATTGNACAAGV